MDLKNVSAQPGNTEGGRIIVLLTSCMTGFIRLFCK
jgi:hypothetical protein